MLDHLGVEVEELGLRSYLLKSGGSQTATLPGLAPEGTMVTFHRSRALSREDIAFVTPDHPLVLAALDGILGLETGNSVFGVWKSSKPDGIFLEAHFVVECIAPSSLHADRFLPATPLRIVVDQSLKDCSDNEEFQNAILETGDVFTLLDTPVFKKKHLPAMLAKASELASARKEAVINNARQKALDQITGEIERLEDLRLINSHVRPAEIEALQELKSSLLEAVGGATVRADALKLVLRLSN
jgi:ATP-dependent helicase HepA